MTDRERLADEAARWVARIDAGDWSDADEAALTRWFDANPRGRGALLEAQAAWAMLDRRTAAAVSPQRRDASRIRSHRPLVAGLIAASLAIAVAVPLLHDPATTYETAIGDVRSVELPDGSRATINTASRVRIDYDATERDAHVDAGEAWFDVAKNPARPFVVRAGDVSVVAVGTAFSVRRTATGADVLVSEGKVRVRSIADGAEILLSAGERASVAAHVPPQAVAVGAASIARALAWRSGRIDFEGTSVAAAIGEFNRYNRARLVLADPSIRDELLDGTFRIDDAAGFARAVGQGLDVPVDTRDPQRIVIGKRP